MKKPIKLERYIYGITLFFITLSGFAQMPIFKRYYIADIPGLNWLAQYYVTHKIHYIFAFVLVGFAAYKTVDFFIDKKKSFQLTRTGYMKALIISCLIITGSMMMVKNLSGTPFTSRFIIFLDISHLGLCMALLFMMVLKLIRNKKKLPV